MPLPYVSLVSQKNHMAIYMMGLYTDPTDTAWFTAAWKARGQRLNMGKSCVRFRKIEDVPLKVIVEAIHRVPSKRYIAMYESALAGTRKTRKVASVSKSVSRKAAKK